MRKGFVVKTLAVFGLIVLAVPASAQTTRKVPQDFATITLAVAAAAAGDTIQVSKGTYSENVVANLDNLTFKGKGATWIGTVAGVIGDQLTVTGNGTTVEGFKFRQGRHQVRIAGDDSIVRKNTFDYAGDHAISIGGDLNDDVATQLVATGATVEKNKVTSPFGAAIRVAATGAVVQNNRVTRALSIAIIVAGNNSVVTKNTVDGAWVHGLRVHGDNTTVTSNRINFARIKGIAISGGDCTVSKNKVSGGTQIIGIHLTKEEENTGFGNDLPYPGTSFVGHTAENNSVSTVHTYGMRVESDQIAGGNVTGGAMNNNKISDISRDGVAVFNNVMGMSLTGNKLKDVHAMGFFIESDTTTMTSNSVTNSGGPASPAFFIHSDTNTLTKCSAKKVGGDGFHIFGDGNTIDNCSAISCGEDGFDVEESFDPSSGGPEVVPADMNTFTKCKAQKCLAEGFDNSGTMTTVNDSTFLKNGIDVVNDGTFATFGAGNKFATGGTAEPPAVDAEVEDQDPD